jgi:hypothetical protein
MPDTILKRWNGTAFEEIYPKTTVGQISASGTPGSTTFLRGDGQWQIPATQPHTHLSADITDLKSNLKFLYIYGKAQSAITKGQAVQFAGVQGDHILMKPAVPSEINANPDYFIGLAESTLATNAFGYVLTQGELVNVNTSTYSEGAILWFASAGSTAGALTATEPTNSNARIQVASVNKVNETEGILFVRVNFVGTEIEDIVATGTPSSSTFLRGDGQWATPADNVHDWQWKWKRYANLVNPAGGSAAQWTDYFRTFFYKPTAATMATHPLQAEGYLDTRTQVNAEGGFGGSNYGNMFGNLESYHAHIYTNIYVEYPFSISISNFNGDDPHAIFIDEVFVHGNVSCCVDTSYSYTFTPGWHRIDLIYAEGGGGDWIRMGWNPKDFTTSIKEMNPHTGFERSVDGSLSVNGTLTVNNNVVWNAGNDGTGSGLDADLLDGQHASYFLDTSGSTQTKSGTLNAGNVNVTGNVTAGRYYQNANGIPTGNLGNPTVTEMALFDEQFYNQTAFYDISRLKFYSSTNGTTWTEITTITDGQKRTLVGGDNGGGVAIPNLTPYYRIEITNNGNYVFLNALYLYMTTSSHATSVKIRARRRSDLTFVNFAISNNTVNLWPGHVYLPFSTIPFLTGGSSSGHYDIVHIDFQPTWSGDPTYGTQPIFIQKLQIWGGYPAGKRNVFSTDENANVAFPAALTGTRLISNVATGTSPLVVTSTTAVTNLNADLLDGLHSSSFFRVDGTYPNTNMNTIVEGYWHVEPTAANLPIAQYGHRWDYDHLNNGQWAAQFYSATSDTDSLWFRQIRNYVAQPWQKLWSSTNDGTGSGLDADLLDGLHSSAFLRKDIGDVAVGNHEFYATATSGNYDTAAIEIREVNLVNNTQTADAYAPSLSWHWGGITAMKMFLAANGQLNVAGATSGQIWHSGNDGASSGLDADLLDGNHASAFLLTTARNAANGVAPLDASSKVPVANLPDFITGAGRGFYLVGTISGAVSLSAAGGLVSQLVGLGGGDYKNMYGYMWTAAAEVTLTWTDQTTLGPTFQYHVLTPGDEGDSTSPVTLEAGDMIVFTKYSDTAGDGNDQQFTFSVINSSDPRFANYLPLNGGTMTNSILFANNVDKGITNAAGTAVFYLDDIYNNTYIKSDDGIYLQGNSFYFRNQSADYKLFVNGTSGNVGIGTTTPNTKLDVNGAINTNNNISWANGNADINGQDANLKFRTWTGSALTEKMRIQGNGNVGIGTTTPGHKLTLPHSSNIAWEYGTGDAFEYTTIGKGDGGVPLAFKTTWTGSPTNKIYAFYGLNPSSVETELLTILNGGNVGIATTTPSEKLEVVGNAKATTFISTQATGTAPLTVASTTAVTNLNADLLDGNHAAAFAPAVHTHNQLVLNQNPTGTTYGNGVAAYPTNYIRQGAGDDDGWSIYGEAGIYNNVRQVFQLEDDLETNGLNSGWFFRNKRTYAPYNATEPFIITGAGDVYFTGSLLSGTVPWARLSDIPSFVPARISTNWNDSTVINNVIGQLAWKNYGNNHTIFDASAGTAPNGSAISVINAQNAWTSSFPTLMGWNGVNTFGVRVDSARAADTATTATTATTANFVNSPDGDRIAGNKLPTSNPRTVRFDFATSGSVDAGNTGNYAGVMTYAPWDGTTSSTGDSSYQLAFVNDTGVNGTGLPGLRLRKGIDSTWGSWNKIWHEGNDGTSSGLDADLLDGNHAAAFALLASPALTGTPTAPTATAGTNTTQIATTAFVSTAVANLINSAPGALDTLDELAAALGDDANFASTITTSLAGKAATSHTHGNIQSGGTMGGSSLTPGSGVNILVSGSDNTIGRSTIAFTGSGTGFLRQDGSWATPTDTTTLTGLGVTSTAAELNVLDGITATTAELNFTDGVTSNIQTQLDGKAATSHTHTVSNISDRGNIGNNLMLLQNTTTSTRFVKLNPDHSVSLESGGTYLTSIGLGNVTNESKATMFSSPTFTGTVSGVTATMVGLGNVTNESKATMFASPTFTGTVSGITAAMVGAAATSHTHTATAISDSGNVGRNLLTTSSATASTLFFKKNPDHTITLETDANFRTSIGAAAASHTHGNISNAGVINTNTAASTGQHLVITSDADLIQQSAITFGTQTTTFLRNDGTWVNPDVFSYNTLASSTSRQNTTYTTFLTSATMDANSRYEVQISVTFYKTSTAVARSVEYNIIVDNTTGTPTLQLVGLHSNIATGASGMNFYVASTTAATGTTFTTLPSQTGAYTRIFNLTGIIFTGTSTKTISIQDRASATLTGGEVVGSGAGSYIKVRKIN